MKLKHLNKTRAALLQLMDRLRGERSAGLNKKFQAICEAAKLEFVGAKVETKDVFEDREGSRARMVVSYKSGYSICSLELNYTFVADNVPYGAAEPQMKMEIFTKKEGRVLSRVEAQSVLSTPNVIYFLEKFDQHGFHAR